MPEVSLKNILAEQEVAVAFLDKALAEDYSRNGHKYKDFNPKDLFDPNNKLSKLSHEEKLIILKYYLKSKIFYSLYSPGKVLYENNPALFGDPEEQNAAYNKCLQAFIDQKAEIYEIINSIPDEYHTELDIFFTDFQCHQLGVSITSGERKFYYEAFLKYLESQLKLSEEQNWPAEKKAVIQKWIAYCNEKIDPKLERTKNVFLDLVSLLLTEGKGEFSITENMPSIQKLAIFNGVLKSSFKDKSIIINDNEARFIVDDLCTNCLPENEAKLAIIDKLDLSRLLKTRQRLLDLYKGIGIFKNTPPLIRAKVATITSVLKTLDDLYKFISQIKPDERNPKMDAAFLRSLPKKEFNYNLHDVFDCILGKKEIKIQVPLESEQSYSNEEEENLSGEKSDKDPVEEINENDIVLESYKRPNSIVKQDPVPLEKPEEEANWFIKFICFIARIFGFETALGYCTNTCKRIAPATPVHKDLKQIAAGKKKKKLIPVHTNTYTKAKNVNQGKNIIPKGMCSGQKNISL